MLEEEGMPRSKEGTVWDPGRCPELALCICPSVATESRASFVGTQPAPVLRSCAIRQPVPGVILLHHLEKLMDIGVCL